MTTDFHNANDALKFLEGKGIDTSAGRVFLASDVEEAVQLSQKARVDGAVGPRPKTMAQAKRMVKADDELMASFDYDRREDFGKSIPAGPNPSSRT
jgi:hypothetical protein